MINRPSHNNSYRQGFTLIEILIVVVILGILASVVLGQFGNAADDAARSTFVTNGKTFVESAMRFQLDTGQFLEDSSCGDLPNGFEDYVQPSDGRSLHRSVACGMPNSTTPVSPQRSAFTSTAAPAQHATMHIWLRSTLSWTMVTSQPAVSGRSAAVGITSSSPTNAVGARSAPRCRYAVGAGATRSTCCTNSTADRRVNAPI